MWLYKCILCCVTLSSNAGCAKTRKVKKIINKWMHNTWQIYLALIFANITDNNYSIVRKLKFQIIVWYNHDSIDILRCYIRELVINFEYESILNLPFDNKVVTIQRAFAINRFELLKWMISFLNYFRLLLKLSISQYLKTRVSQLNVTILCATMLLCNIAVQLFHKSRTRRVNCWVNND